MKQLKNYEACEIEIISLADVITSSGGDAFEGSVDEWFSSPSTYSAGGSSAGSYGSYEW